MANEFDNIVGWVMAYTDEQARDYSTRLAENALQIHLNAPRNNSSINYFGERRGDTFPAMEFGRLAELISSSPTKVDGGYETVVNYLPLEDGYDGRRPMRMAEAAMAVTR